MLLYARQYGTLPADLVGSLTGLTEGARFPVAADARYADDISERQALKRSKPGKRAAGNAAQVISSSPTRRGIDIFSQRGAPVVAVNDGVITRIGKSKKLGRYIVLRDAYGNRFTYAELGEVSQAYPAPKPEQADGEGLPARLTEAGREAEPAGHRRAPDEAPRVGVDRIERCTAREARPDELLRPGRARWVGEHRGLARPPLRLPAASAQLRARRAQRPARRAAGEEDAGLRVVQGLLPDVLRFDPKTMDLQPLKVGSEVIAGTVLGRIEKTDELAPHVHFAIRPTGRGAPKIDPKPILDGWKLLESTAIYRAAGKNPFTGTASTGQVLLMSKTQLIQRTLADPSLSIYACGRNDIRTGQIDRRVLAMLEYLTSRGYDLTITSLKCGHSIMTTSGNVSEHSTGDAVDIAMINGVPVFGHQGPGTLADSLVRDLLKLQGSMQPHQIISLMDYFGAANTFAMADHDDHVHVGYQPIAGPGSGAVSSSSTRS